MAGFIFHGLEEYLLSLELLPIAREHFVAALVEILSLQKENPLWDAVSSIDRLNWIYGWDGFDTRFRNFHGFA